MTKKWPSKSKPYLWAVSLFLASSSSTLLVVTAKQRDYLYRTLPGNESAPILDYYSANKHDVRPDFLYSAKYPHHRVVEFYSPMCPHCVHFAPHYIAFARHYHDHYQPQQLSHDQVVVEFHAVSCLVHRDVCKDQKIGSYPSLKIFPRHSSKGVFVRYTNLHPLTVTKTLGISMVDEDDWQQEEQDTTTHMSDKEIAKAVNQQVPPFVARRLPELYADAYLSLYYTMKTSVFVVASDDKNGIPKDKQNVFFQFLELLSKVMPPFDRLHQFLQALIGPPNKKQVLLFDHLQSPSTWESLLEQHPPRHDDWSPACQLHNSPYTCGLWTLLHIVTIGVVEYNAQLTAMEPTSSRTTHGLLVDPATAAATLKEFVQHFFLCTDCVSHFVQEYNACHYDRCQRLGSNSKATALLPSSLTTSPTMKEWQELPLWLLETHNGVNVRLFHDLYHDSQTTPMPPNGDQTVLWPPLAECPGCWVLTTSPTASTKVTTSSTKQSTVPSSIMTSREKSTNNNGTIDLRNAIILSPQKYNHTMMYNYLRLVYWPEDSQSVVIRDELRLASSLSSLTLSAADASSSSSSFAAMNGGQRILTLSVEMQYALVVVLVLVAVVLSNKRRLERLLGISLSWGSTATKLVDKR